VFSKPNRPTPMNSKAAAQNEPIMTALNEGPSVGRSQQHLVKDAFHMLGPSATPLGDTLSPSPTCCRLLQEKHVCVGRKGLGADLIHDACRCSHASVAPSAVANCSSQIQGDAVPAHKQTLRCSTPTATLHVLNEGPASVHTGCAPHCWPAQ
jgi:hypothetical protein